MGRTKRIPSTSVAATFAAASAAEISPGDGRSATEGGPPEYTSATRATAAFLEQMQRERGPEFAMANIGLARVVGALVTGDEAGQMTPLSLEVFATAYLNGDISKPESLTLIELACAIMAIMDKAPEAARREYFDALEGPLSERQENEPRAQQFRRLVALLRALDQPITVDLHASRSGVSLQPIIDYRPDRKRSRLAIDHFTENFRHLPREQRPFSDEVRRANYKYWQALSTHQSRLGKSIDELFPIRKEAAGGAIVKLRKAGALGLNPAEELARRRALGRANEKAHRERKKRKALEPRG